MHFIMEMGGVMMHLTQRNVILILEIVVAMSSTLIIASTAYALKQFHQQLKVQLRQLHQHRQLQLLLLGHYQAMVPVVRKIPSIFF